MIDDKNFCVCFFFRLTPHFHQCVLFNCNVLLKSNCLVLYIFLCLIYFLLNFNPHPFLSVCFVICCFAVLVVTMSISLRVLWFTVYRFLVATFALTIFRGHLDYLLLSKHKYLIIKAKSITCSCKLCCLARPVVLSLFLTPYHFELL